MLITLLVPAIIFQSPSLSVASFHGKPASHNSLSVPILCVQGAIARQRKRWKNHTAILGSVRVSGSLIRSVMSWSIFSRLRLFSNARSFRMLFHCHVLQFTSKSYSWKKHLRKKEAYVNMYVLGTSVFTSHVRNTLIHLSSVIRFAYSSRFLSAIVHCSSNCSIWIKLECNQKFLVFNLQISPSWSSFIAFLETHLILAFSTG